MSCCYRGNKASYNSVTELLSCTSAGQFQQADVSVTVVEDHVDEGAHQRALSARGTLRWGSQHVHVTLQDKTLKDSVQKQHTGKCWVVAKAEVERLLGHPYQSYVVARGA